MELLSTAVSCRHKTRKPKTLHGSDLLPPRTLPSFRRTPLMCHGMSETPLRSTGRSPENSKRRERRLASEVSSGLRSTLKDSVPEVQDMPSIEAAPKTLKKTLSRACLFTSPAFQGLRLHRSTFGPPELPGEAQMTRTGSWRGLSDFRLTTVSQDVGINLARQEH